MDYKSAFDCISHPKLLLKLSSYGITGNLYLWIKSFLTSRTQIVKINSSNSLSCPVTSGVVQGSVIGPMLFNIFINDVTTHVDHNTTIKLFADDIKIYTDLPNISPTNLQTQLNNIHQWSSTWQMQISYSKCNIIHIGSSNSPHNLHTHNIPIKQVGSVVDFGVTIDEHLRFKIHINTIIQKANQRSALIKRCFLSRNATNLLRAY